MSKIYFPSRADVRERATAGRDKATPNGVFDRPRERPVRGLGGAQQAFRNIQKDIPETLLAYV